MKKVVCLKLSYYRLWEYHNLDYPHSTSHWRDAKKPNREEKEKFKNNFSTFEKRRRNLNSFASSREEKQKSQIFLPSFERRKRNLNSFFQFREEKEKSRIPLPSFEKRKRNWQISNFREEKFKTKFLYGYIHLRE